MEVSFILQEMYLFTFKICLMHVLMTVLFQFAWLII